MPASTSSTPAKRGNQRVPIRSQAAAERSSVRERVGGTNSAPALRVGVNILVRSSFESWGLL